MQPPSPDQSPAQSSPPEVQDNQARSRFELELGADTAFIDYYRAGNVRVLAHAEVPPARRGAGIGARLTAGALELIRARGERVVARCPYVARFIRQRPEFADLLAPELRSEASGPNGR